MLSEQQQKLAECGTLWAQACTDLTTAYKHKIEYHQLWSIDTYQLKVPYEYKYLSKHKYPMNTSTYQPVTVLWADLRFED